MGEKSWPVRVSAQAWRCPCGRDMGVPERPVCDCGEWSLDGLVKPQKVQDKPEPTPASLSASERPAAAETAKQD